MKVASQAHILCFQPAALHETWPRCAANLPFPPGMRTTCNIMFPRLSPWQVQPVQVPTWLQSLPFATSPLALQATAAVVALLGFGSVVYRAMSR